MKNHRSPGLDRGPSRDGRKPFRNERGFALVLMLPLVVFLLMCLFFFYRQAHTILTDKESRSVCRDELLKAQDKVRGDLEKLLDLNPKISAAKKAKIIAELALIAAAGMENPFMAAEAERAIEAATKILDALKVAQKALLAKAKIDLGMGLYNTQKSLRGVWANRDRSRTQIEGASGFITSASPPHVAVRPKDADDPYPEYELEPEFSDKQALQVSWRVKLQQSEEKNSWIKKDWSLRRTCGATLVANSDGNTFRAKLTEAKSSSKSWFFF